MSKRIAVRLPDDIVEFVDGLVEGGQAASRDVVVERALDRERRRDVAARTPSIVAGVDADHDLANLGQLAVHTRLDCLD